MTQISDSLTTNRLYKARLFKVLFHEKEKLLELYNAANGTHYTDPELLEINTLKNAIYMSMHNDISFIIDSNLSLYEHQSTYNPNIPLRNLMYMADLYSAIVKDENLYGRKRVKIPTPRFIVFYNGIGEQPDSQVLKLSDMFQTPVDKPSLELEAIMLNINPGHNKELLAASKTLRDYSEYTARVRKYASQMKLEDAVEKAIAECIKGGIMSDFLLKHRAEAKKMSIYEYDEEKHIRQEREDAWEDGRKSKLMEQIQKKQAKGKNTAQIAEDLEEDIEIIEQLMK